MDETYNPGATIVNIHDGQTLGTSFTAYGTYTTAFAGTPGVLCWLFPDTQSSDPPPIPTLALAQGGYWQKDFVDVLPYQYYTLKAWLVDTADPRTRIGAEGVAVHLTVAAGARIGLEITPPTEPAGEVAREDQLPSNYRPSGKIEAIRVPESITSILVKKGREISRFEAHKQGGTWTGDSAHDLQGHRGAEVSHIVEVKIPTDHVVRMISVLARVKNNDLRPEGR